MRFNPQEDVRKVPGKEYNFNEKTTQNIKRKVGTCMYNKLLTRPTS